MADPPNSTSLEFSCSKGHNVPANILKSSALFAVLKTLIPTESCLAVLIVLVNSTVIMTILVTKSLRSKTYYKGIACMNILDFLTGAVNIPLTCLSYKRIIDNSSPMTICLASLRALVCAHTLSSLTISGMVFLSIDRYFSICHALKYHEIFSKRRAVMVMVLLVSPSIATNVLLVLDKTKFVFVMSAEVFLVIFLFSVIYYKIFKKVAHSGAQSHRGSFQSRKQRDMSWKLLVIVVVIFISYAPIGLLPYIMKLLSKEGRFSAYYIANALLLTNSLINPILFIWQDSALRKATFTLIRDILFKLRCSRKEHLSNNRVSTIELPVVTNHPVQE